MSPISHYRPVVSIILHPETFFQGELKSLFPTWEKILFHQEVIKFACGMAGNLQVLLKLIIDRLLTHLCDSKQYLNTNNKTLLKSIEKELPEGTNISVLNNKWFNYVSEDNPIVFIPSKFYILDYVKAVDYQYDRPALSNVPVAECHLNMNGFLGAIESLDVLKEIKTYQELLVARLNISGSTTEPQVARRPQEIVQLAPGLLRLSKSIRHVSLMLYYDRIEYHRALLAIFQCIIKQLCGCQELENLSLDFRRVETPSEDYYIFPNAETSWISNLDKALATMRSLQTVYVQSTYPRLEDGYILMSGLSFCQNLRSMDLANNHLTSFVPYLFGGNHDDEYGFQFLEKVNLANTGLSYGDVVALSRALNRNQLPHLKELQLSNNVLRNHLGIVVTATNFTCLENLDLSATALNKEDVMSLSQTLCGDNLPILQHLSLSDNVLTDCMQYLTTGHEGQTCAILNFNLANTKLSGADLKYLALAMRNNMLSKCHTLSLSRNALSGNVYNLFRDGKLPFVCELQLGDTSMNTEDIVQLGEAIKNGKLPEIKMLYLGFDSSINLKSIIPFYEVCIDYYNQQRKQVIVDFSLPDPKIDLNELINRIADICKGTYVIPPFAPY